MGFMLKHSREDIIVDWIKRLSKDLKASSADASARETLLEICKWESKAYDWRFKRRIKSWGRSNYMDIFAEVIKACSLLPDTQLLYEAVTAFAKYSSPGKILCNAVAETLCYLPFDDVKPWCVPIGRIFEYTALTIMNSFDKIFGYKRTFEMNLEIIESLRPTENIHTAGFDYADLVTQYKEWKLDAIKSFLGTDNGFVQADVGARVRVLGEHDKEFAVPKLALVRFHS